MGWRYVDEDRNFGGCLLALVVVAIIFFVILYLAAYALIIALGIILVISGIIGAVLTIKNYVLAFINSVRKNRYITSPRYSRIPNGIYRWAVICWEALKEGIEKNITDIKNFFRKSGTYRFFSFGKWICLFTVVSSLFFGSAVSLSIIFAHLAIMLVVVAIIAIICVVVNIICAMIGVGISVPYVITNYIARLSDSYNSSASSFVDYIIQFSFREYGRVICNYWNENITFIKDCLSQFSTSPILSTKKWVKLNSAIMIAVIGTVLFLVFALIHIVFISIFHIICLMVHLFKR